MTHGRETKGTMIKIEYLKTMDFDWNNVKVLNCYKLEDIFEKIKGNEVLQVEIAGQIYYINSSYVMYFK
ncbi:MAG: hypothetical protein ACI4U9_03285 [Clostridia bacterium]